MNFIRRIKTRYVLHRYPIQHAAWFAATDRLKILHRLSAVEKAHFRELSTLFLHEKQFIGIGIDLDDEMRVIISAQACLPILHLGVELLSGWTDIIVYPDAFYVNHDQVDEYGVVHQQERLLSGEAWSRGPIVLSWSDIERDISDCHSGHNVIIHEIAHKLDMLDGSSNGIPPLHYRMPIPKWTTALHDAYSELQHDIQRHERTGINPYAATSPAEFFAVMSEYFFTASEVLTVNFPLVYRQLQQYYRQTPLDH
jgi:Mlc titration factor MtfA (ptsG expression regulator)